MARYRTAQRRRERNAAPSYGRRVLKSSHYVGSYSPRYDYLTELEPLLHRAVSRVSAPARKAAVPRGRIKRRDKRATQSFFNPFATILAKPVLKQRTLSEKPQIRTAKLCKCTHERSDDQRRVSRKFFGGYGSRGLDRKEHICKC